MRMVLPKASCALWLALMALPAMAQEVRNTSFTTDTGDRVLRFETTVSAPLQEVWNAFATTPGLNAWFSPDAVVDLRVGGSMRARNNRPGKIGDTGAATIDILSYAERERITYKIHLDDRFSETIREQDENLRETIELAPAGEKRTKIVSSIFGWGTGRIWDDAYAFFLKRNERNYVRLTMMFPQRGGQ